MLTITSSVHDIKELARFNDFVQQIARFNQRISKGDKTFSEYLAHRVLAVLHEVQELQFATMNNMHRNTNEDWFELYKKNHRIQYTDNGFKIYNNTTKFAGLDGNKQGYDFSIALAFEYGVGIVGENTAKEGAWAYNINKYNFGWTFINEQGEREHTYGYEGMEIYRYTRIEVEEQIVKWIEEYIRSL